MKLIFSGRIYNHKRIREKYPDALLISVMRKPWRYTPRDIIIMPDLGPPEILLNYVRSHLDNKGQALVDLQAYYVTEFFKYLNNEAGAALKELNELMLHDSDMIILLCSEEPGEFCHRHLLRYYLLDNYDILNGGEIILRSSESAEKISLTEQQSPGVIQQHE